MSDEAVLDARELTVVRSGVRLLDSVGLHLQPGTLAAVVGPNGAGKSTLLKVLTGEWTPDSGQVRLWGRPLGEWPARELARVRAVLPQSSALAFGFTVEEVVAMGRTPWDEPLVEKHARVQAALEEVGMRPLAHRRWPTLSGGERQRVQLARVFAQLPPDPADGLLFLDEPTNHLDLTHQVRVLQRVRARVERGGTALAVLHDLSLAARMADRVVVLSGGRVVSDGPPEAALHPDVLRPVFGLELTQVRLDRGFALVPSL